MTTRTSTHVEDGRMVTFAREDDSVIKFQKIDRGMVVSFYRNSDALSYRTRTFIAGHDAYILLKWMAENFRMNVEVEEDDGLNELLEALNGTKCKDGDGTEEF